MGRVPDGYGLLQKLPMSLPPVTVRRVARLLRMANSEKASQRAAAAGNPLTPEFALEILATDPDLTVRSWVARNPVCPPRILVDLSAGTDDLAAYARWKLGGQ